MLISLCISPGRGTRSSRRFVSRGTVPNHHVTGYSAGSGSGKVVWPILGTAGGLVLIGAIIFCCYKFCCSAEDFLDQGQAPER